MRYDLNVYIIPSSQNTSEEDTFEKETTNYIYRNLYNRVTYRSPDGGRMRWGRNDNSAYHDSTTDNNAYNHRANPSSTR